MSLAPDETRRFRGPAPIPTTRRSYSTPITSVLALRRASSPYVTQLSAVGLAMPSHRQTIVLASHYPTLGGRPRHAELSADDRPRPVYRSNYSTFTRHPRHDLHLHNIRDTITHTVRTDKRNANPRHSLTLTLTRHDIYIYKSLK